MTLENEEHEDVYVALELVKPNGDSRSDPRSWPIDINLDQLQSKNPTVRIGSRHYDARINPLIGSELYVDAQGEVFGLARDKIQLRESSTLETKRGKQKAEPN